MSEFDIEKAIRSATASLEMEGFTVDEETKDLCRKVLRKEITIEQYIDLVKQKVGVGNETEQQ